MAGTGSVAVVGVTRLGDIGLAAGAQRIVVDATGSSGVPLPVLARLVRLRRVLRAYGGELVVAAGADTAGTLRRSGLSRSLPFRSSVAAALELLGGGAGRVA